jgi:squalene synthase HpnC
MCTASRLRARTTRTSSSVPVCFRRRSGVIWRPCTRSRGGPTTLFVGDRRAALDAWERELDEALVARPSGPVFRAVAHTVRERRLSDEPLRALLRAFRYDVDFQPFRDFDALRGYCRDSANPVGQLVLGLFGVCDARSVALSDDVCTGLQLANFWQDLSVDLAHGRSYLPTAEIEAFPGAGVAIADRSTNQGFEALLSLQLERARYFLSAGEELAARLPLRAAIEVRMFAGGGLRIVDRVEELSGRILTERPKLRRADFTRVLAGSVVRSVFPGSKALDPRTSARPPRARPKGVV